MHMNAFTANIADGGAYDLVEMTNAIQDRPTVPGFLTGMGIFTPKPVRTEDISIEKRGQTLRLIPQTERGSPLPRNVRNNRTLRNFKTGRVGKADQMRPAEIQNVRAFGTESELEAMATELAIRQAELADDHALTMEYHALGAINGEVLDADGTTVIEDYFDAFGITRPAAINFNWPARQQVKTFIANNVTRAITRALGGRATPGMRIIALCGDNFYDSLQENEEYRATYLNGIANPQILREENVFESITAWGVTWINYRGTDDNSTVAIAPNECRIFVQGVPDVFQTAYSPEESFQYANTRGLDMYSRLVTDPSGYDAYVELSVMNYPLFMCTTPEVLLSGVAA